MTTREPADVEAFLARTGAALHLGAVDAWPSPVRVLAELMAVANQAMFLTWGPERRIIYNDLYAEIMGSRHPAGFGQPFDEVWADILDEVGPMLARAYQGQSTAMDDIELWFEQDGRRSERHFSFSYSPVRTVDGRIGGAFCACTETTSGVLAERAATRAHQHLHRLFAQAPSFIAILQGPNHVYEFVNDAYTRLIGGRACVGVGVGEALPEVVSQGFIALLDTVYQSGRRYIASGMCVRLQSPPGHAPCDYYLDFIYEPILDDAGNVSGIFVEGHDVTDAYLARQAEAATTERYRDLLSAMGEGLLILDDELHVIEANDSALALGARSRDQVIGQPYLAIWPRAAGSAIETAYRRAVAERIAFSLEYACRPGDQPMWMDVHIYPIRGGIAAFYRDITQLKRASLEVQRSRDRFQAAVQAIGVMWTNDSEGRMRAPQPGWSELTGQAPEDYQGYGWAAVVHPDDVAPTVQSWEAAVSAGHTYQFEHRVRRRDGQWRLFSIKAEPVFGADGHIVEWVGVHIDITDARRDSEALLAASRQKDEFLAVLAHELRNPLAPIRNAAQILTVPTLTNEHLAACRAIIARQIGHMAMLLDDLLDVSRVSRGRFELRKAYVSLRTVVDSAVVTSPAGSSTRRAWR
ncbi:MAG: PAS domain-containing protein, partial [Niabella sp.]